MTYFLWLGIVHVWYVLCIMPMVAAVGTKTVTLEAFQPSTGPVCPGQELILTCTVVQTGDVQILTLSWKQKSVTCTCPTYEYMNNSKSAWGPQTLGDFITTAVFMTSATSTMIVSNATLTSAALSNNNNMITCKSPPLDNAQTAIITIAGNNNHRACNFFSGHIGSRQFLQRMTVSFSR